MFHLPIRRVLFPTIALLVAIFLGTQVKSSAALSADDRDALKKKAVEIATKVPKDMGLLDRTPYIMVPVDRHDEKGTLEDSDIQPFIPPILMTTDWVMVLFLPEKVDAGPRIAVYVEMKLGVVRGYFIGPRQTPK